MFGCGRIGYDDNSPPSDASRDGMLRSYRELILADSPHVYFRLGETGGNLVMDATGGRHVIEQLGSTITLGVSGALADDGDPAMRFDGEGNLSAADDYAVVRLQPPDPLWAGDFTIEALVNTDRPTPEFGYPMFICEDYMVNGFRVGWTDAQTLRFWTDEAGGATNLFSTLDLIEIGVWQHVVFARRGNTAEMYLDGVYAGGGALVGYLAPSSTAECGFGSFHGMPLHATFDELAIYPRALDPALIAAHAARAGR